MTEWMRKWNKANRVMLGVAKVGLALALVGTGLAQTPRSPGTPQGVKAQAPEAVAKPDSPTRQGVKVSGWWTINVKNPDGSLVSHVEFENSLVLTNFLPGLLVGAYSAGPPAIALGGLCQNNTPCYLFVPAAQTCPSYCSTNLTYNLHSPGNGGEQDGVVLAGTYTAAVAGTIKAVATRYVVCGPDAENAVQNNASQLPSFGKTRSHTSPADCAAGTLQPGESIGDTLFTKFDMIGAGNPAPVPVAAGQIVQVSVVLTFS